jgi:lipopolysaccharide/colanic/teichoic acid biosynthesis glycosyltransferase
MNFSENIKSNLYSINNLDKASIKLNCIFLGGHNSDITLDNNFFVPHTVLSNFTDTKHYVHLIQVDNHPIPDAIFITLPLSVIELEDFGLYLNSFPRLKNIPLIYCSKKVTIKDFSFLKSSELVDDVIDLESFGVDLYKRISFLKKVKNHPPAPFLIRLDHLERASDFMSNGYALKRILDIFAASIILIISLPLFVLIAIAIKLDSKGPIFYNALRAGKKYKIFKFHKFRSMVVDAEDQVKKMAHLNQYEAENNGVAFLKIKNDPRVTKVGKFLRKTSLDELPQLFNVLKGDMSRVGNRPLPLREAESLTTNEYIERFMAPAGITGLWQITKKGKPNMTSEERIDLDIVYAQRANLISDLKIMIKTPGVLFQNVDN